jgi:phenylalanyl-tRNA synthetase beta chain
MSVERSAGALDVIVPSWRADLTIEDDIAEEVGRIALGYENLAETLPPVRSGAGRDSPRGSFISAVREALVRAGLQEVQSHSLTAPSPLLAGQDEAAHRVTIRSALSPELSSLRTSLLPNLIEIAARANASGLRDLALFEVGPVYRKEDDGSYREPLRITALFAGSAMPREWSVKPDALPADFFFAKGVAQELLRALGVPAMQVAAAEAEALLPGGITHPGRTGTIRAGGETLGVVAELSEAVVTTHDLPRRTCVFDLDGDALMRLGRDGAQIRYAPLPRYPAVTRDLAPVLAISVPYADVEAVATRTAGPLLESLRLTDVYEGPNLGAGRRALTLRLTFRSPERTLKEAEVEEALGRVRAALHEELGADLRAG